MTLINSTKKPEPLFATQIAQDILPIFYELLKKGTKGDGLDIIVYSAGGQIDTPWPLVNLIREYYKDVRVLVPWKAHSAATLIALGANKIEMGPLGSLSPIDPQFQVIRSDKELIGAGIEDIYGYYTLIKQDLQLDSNGKTEALKILANRVSPELLGKICRSHKEIRIIATNLLHLHLHDEGTISSIVAKLVEELPSHQYMINRREAKTYGLPIENFDSTTERIVDKILESYTNETRMNEPGMNIDFGTQDKMTIEMNRAFVETQTRSFAFHSSYTFHKDGKAERKGDVWQEGKRNDKDEIIYSSG